MNDISHSNLRGIKLKEFRKNPEEAFKKLKSAADEGNTDSYSLLGCAYEIGIGIPQADYFEAKNWYEKSYRDKIDVWGAIGLGRLYYMGTGVEVDDKKAWKLFKEVENYKIDYVYLMLGRMSFLGRGVEKDLHAAKDYFAQAASLGNVWAIKYLGIVELKLGHYLRGISLWAKATWMGVKIASQDIDDPRLVK